VHCPLICVTLRFDPRFPLFPFWGQAIETSTILDGTCPGAQGLRANKRTPGDTWKCRHFRTPAAFPLFFAIPIHNCCVIFIGSEWASRVALYLSWQAPRSFPNCQHKFICLAKQFSPAARVTLMRVSFYIFWQFHCSAAAFILNDNFLARVWGQSRHMANNE